MFGSIFKMRPQPGKKADLLNLFTDDSRPAPSGMRAAYMFDTGGDEVWGVAVFDDEKSYRANAESPEQDQEYQQMRALLTADPEWHDATVQAWPGIKS